MSFIYWKFCLWIIFPNCLHGATVKTPCYAFVAVYIHRVRMNLHFQLTHVNSLLYKSSFTKPTIGIYALFLIVKCAQCLVDWICLLNQQICCIKLKLGAWFLAYMISKAGMLSPTVDFTKDQYCNEFLILQFYMHCDFIPPVLVVYFSWNLRCRVYKTRSNWLLLTF